MSLAEKEIAKLNDAAKAALEKMPKSELRALFELLSETDKNVIDEMEGAREGSRRYEELDGVYHRVHQLKSALAPLEAAIEKAEELEEALR